MTSALGLQPQLLTPTFRGIQVVRGLAACMVVVFHASQMWSVRVSGSVNSMVWTNGAAGIDIFFVVSGFVMAVSSIGKGDGPSAARKFLERRFVRILPLYWLITTVLLIKLTLWHPHVDLHNPVQTPLFYIVNSYLLIPSRSSLGVSIAPLLAPGWTLSYEMFFYLWFAAALALRGSVVRILTVALGLLAAVSLFHKDTWPAFTVLFDPILLEFLAGLWLGRAVQLGWRMNATVAGVLGSAALAALFVLPAPHSYEMQRLEWGAIGFFIVLAAVLLEDRMRNRVPRWTLLLGDASYSLYLSHYLLLNLSARILVRLHALTPGTIRLRDELLTMAICLVVSGTVALAIYLWIEQPMNSRLRQLLRLRQARTQPTVAILS
jgi:exopolysaccharide production protein ExoZ